MQFGSLTVLYTEEGRRYAISRYVYVQSIHVRSMSIHSKVLIVLRLFVAFAFCFSLNIYATYSILINANLIEQVDVCTSYSHITIKRRHTCRLNWMESNFYMPCSLLSWDHVCQRRAFCFRFIAFSRCFATWRHLLLTLMFDVKWSLCLYKVHMISNYQKSKRKQNNHFKCDCCDRSWHFIRIDFRITVNTIRSVG